MAGEAIVRVFRATVKPGKEAAFAKFFLEQAVPLLRRQEGCTAIQVGLPTADHPQDFLMVTTWRDLDALRGFAGDEWDQAVIEPEEQPLLSSTSVSHYRDAGI
jgi:heme-degrading monooxygenase HmoA